MKTKAFIFYAITILYAAMSFSACSDESESVNNGIQIPLQINLKGCSTRTVINGDKLPTGSQFGIYAINSDGEIGYSNVLTKYENSQCNMAETIYLTEKDKEIVAYYPYSEKVLLNSLYIDSRAQIDYMYGYAVNENDEKVTVNASCPKADILLKHAMSRVTLSIRKSNNNAGSIEYVKSAMLTGVPLSGNLNLQTGEMTTASNGDLVVSTEFPLTINGESVDILVPPCEITPNVGLSLKIGEKYYYAQMPRTELKSGQQYTYAVEVSNGSLLISKASITPWIENNQDGIEIGDDNYVE